MSVKLLKPLKFEQLQTFNFMLCLHALHNTIIFYLDVPIDITDFLKILIQVAVNTCWK